MHSQGENISDIQEVRALHTLKSITDPKNMFITDIRNRRERPDISVPKERKNIQVELPLLNLRPGPRIIH